MTLIQLAQDTICHVLPILIQLQQAPPSQQSNMPSIVGLVLQALSSCYHLLRSLTISSSDGVQNEGKGVNQQEVESVNLAFDLAHYVLGTSVRSISKSIEKMSLLLHIQVALYSMNQFHLEHCFQVS